MRIMALSSPEELQAEDEGFYHESALNAAWTGARLAIGGFTFLFGCFAFSYFFLRSVNSEGRWQGAGYAPPQLWMGTLIMLLAVISAGLHYFGLQRIKLGHKETWVILGWISLGLGLGAVGTQIYQLTDLPFPPGSSGYSSVFVGFYPVLLVSQLAILWWLEMLLVRARNIPAISFVEQPPTVEETYSVQRFQASLSAFSTLWVYLALIALLFYLLFYAF
jgi:heme/copper-type cytochrome/quinol oxidase subunit 3